MTKDLNLKHFFFNLFSHYFYVFLVYIMSVHYMYYIKCTMHMVLSGLLEQGTGFLWFNDLCKDFPHISIIL